MEQDGYTIIRALKGDYRSGVADLAKNFFIPCLRYCSNYRRAVGYFSSTALLSWLSGLARLGESHEMRFQLIISHEVSKEDASALRACITKEARIRLLELTTENIIDVIVALGKNPNRKDDRALLFAWLIVKGYLDIRLAFATHIEEPGIFHEKIGIFEFPWGDQVAFTGSANETLSGHTRNYETIDVYRSWMPADHERVITKCQQFDEAWNGLAPGLDVLPISQKSLDRLREIAPRDRPKIDEPPVEQAPTNLWQHQDEALKRFLQARRGILEMATGTGKTRTALNILTELDGQKLINGAIIATDGNDLLDQWSRELDKWMVGRSKRYSILRHYKSHHQLSAFSLSPENSILVISRAALPELMRLLRPQDRSKLAIIHDEVHGLGMPGIRAGLAGQHARFPFVLGLSATPERAYDDEGNDFIENEIGTTIFNFPLEAAIARGILCEFDYVPLEYELTEDDRARLQRVYAMQAGRAHGGSPMSDTEIWIEIAKVYKTAEMKPHIFADYVYKNSGSLKRSLIFVETKEYGERLLETIHKYTNLYRTYYAEDDQDNLFEFSKGGIDCLITCHRISQGIDIKSLRSAFLFSSARSKLETIQRMGRCLRTDPEDPNKRALIVDFVRKREDDAGRFDADAERCEWLMRVAQTRKGDEIGY